jgi:hypothetical protein
MGVTIAKQGKPTVKLLAKFLGTPFPQLMTLTKRAEEEQPLLRTEKSQNSNWILHFIHRRLQSRESRSQIPPSTHLHRRLASSGESCIIAVALVVLGRVASFPV